MFSPTAVLAQVNITGRVVNGTTNRPGANQKVELLTLGQGMKAESETQTGPDGTFSFTGIRATTESPHLLLRTIYQGVNYNLSVSPDQGSSGPLNVTIYETTQKLDDIKVSLPLMLAQASGSSLYVQQQYLVENNTQPKRTLVNPYATFLFDTPQRDTVSELNVSVVGLAGIPLPQIPTPRQEGGYVITYPMKPGVNEVRVGYRVSTSSDQRQLKHRLFHGTTLTKILVLPADLQVSGEGVQPAGKDARTQGALYQVTNIPKGEFLNLKIFGSAPEVSEGQGEGNEGGEDEQQAQVRVVRLPNRVFQNKQFILVGFGALFVVAILYGLRQRYHLDSKGKGASRKDLAD